LSKIANVVVFVFMIGAAIVVATRNTHIKDMVDEMDDYI